MKKTILLFILLALTASSIFADDWKIRLIENETSYLEIQMQCVNAGLTPQTADPLSGFTFQIFWPTSLGADIHLICTSNPYNITSAGGLQTTAPNNWREYYIAGAPISCPATWTTGEWETITTFKVDVGTGSGNFDVAPDLTYGAGLNWQFGDPAVTYHPDVLESGALGYSFPTIVYNYVWKGGSGSPALRARWEYAPNWTDACGGAAPEGFPYYTGNPAPYIVIPGGLSYYPTTTSNNDDDWGWAGNRMFIMSGAQVTVPDLSAHITSPAELHIDGDLIIAGTLNLPGNGNSTVTGTTTINSEEGIVVQANATAIGSFINNGDIYYGTGGSAKVQTYLVNGAPSGSFQIHLVGPTVNMTGSGVPLSAFDVVPGDTYAYAYDEPTGNWVNLVNPTNQLIPTAKGIGLSTTDATDHTLEMTGNLNYGSISSPAMTSGGVGTGYNMLSNPYPSAIYWNDMHGDNSSSVNDIVYVWDASFGTGGNYRAYNVGSGGTDDFTGYIQVGQGFFVQSTGTNTFEFDNSQRHHSAAPFYGPTYMMDNRLDVRVAGTNYRDGLLLHFYEGAASGFEPNEDAPKRDSPYDKVPEIWTDLQDGSRLSINAMPIELLGIEMLTVPLSFDCGLADTYTLSFLDIESFESGTEIWLEDKQTGAEWVNLNEFPEYVFTGAVGDLTDRFDIHFFGPTGVNEFTNELTVDIYSYGNFAYVVNDTDEMIENILLYNLSGALMMNNDEVPEQRTHKFWVSDRLGYFIVKVITDKNIYIKKVLISN